MKQFTSEQAIKLYDLGEWKNWTDEEIVKFQLFQKYCCVDFGRFQMAMGKVLGRSVWTHEFGNQENLIKEYLGIRRAPTFQEIFDMIPEGKRIVLYRQY